MAGFRNVTFVQDVADIVNYYPAKWQGSETPAALIWLCNPHNYYPAKWQGSETEYSVPDCTMLTTTTLPNGRVQKRSSMVQTRITATTTLPNGRVQKPGLTRLEEEISTTTLPNGRVQKLNTPSFISMSSATTTLPNGRVQKLVR